MSIKIIPTTETDRAFCRKVHHIAYRPIIDYMFGWNELQQDTYADSDFDERNLHIIHAQNKPVGVVGWQDKTDHLWFGPLMLLPEHQNKGIGSFIIKQFIDTANGLKLPLRLQTLKQNTKAKDLYEKLGFRVLSSCAIYWQMEYAEEETSPC